MPLPTEEEKILLGPLILPFGRNMRTDKIKELAKGEGILYDIEQGVYDAKNDGNPDNVVYISEVNFNLLIDDCSRYRDDFFESKYLWVIGIFGLRLIRENTRNSARVGEKKYVCHTNLTGGNEAYQGGELWFCKDGRIGINYFSDRYGATTVAQWKAVIQHFQNVGYNKVIELVPWREKK